MTAIQPTHQAAEARIFVGDCREILPRLPKKTVNCVVTSPPYWNLRDYDVGGQIGIEGTIQEYVSSLVDVFGLVRDVLRDDGTVWLVLGDSYAQSEIRNRQGQSEFSILRDDHDARTKNHQVGRKVNHGLKNKNLIGMPWRIALALQDDGWILRSDIIWSKPNAMPESAKDRPTKSHEYVFLLAKRQKYYYDYRSIQVPSKEGGRKNKRTVWQIPVGRSPGVHFATFPQPLAEACVLAGCPEKGTVLDPFLGSGVTSLVARDCGCRSIGIEINEEYAKLAYDRLRQRSLLA